MPRTMPPAQCVEVEKMGYRDGLNIRPQLCLAFEKDVIISYRVVLHVVIGMRWQRRAVRIHRIGVARARAVFVVTSADVAIGDSSPLSGSKIKGMDV